MILERFARREFMRIEDAMLWGGEEEECVPWTQIRKPEETIQHIIIINFKYLPVLDALPSAVPELIQSSQLYEADFLIFPILKLGKLRLTDVM